MFPLVHISEKEKKKNEFVQEQVYIESPSNFPPIKEEKPKKEQERGSVIIQLW